LIELLGQDDYPGIDLDDIGKAPNIGYGDVPGVRCHLIQGGATSLLLSAISASDLTIEVQDAARFPATPFTIQVGSERMRVTNVAATTFTVTRGYDSTTATAHAIERTVFEVRTEYVYLVADHAVTSIDTVFIDRVRQSTGFTAYTGQAGDSHADYPGKAVVAFAADGEISRQFNLQLAETEAPVNTLAGLHATWSDFALADGAEGTFVEVGGSFAPVAFVTFGSVSGSVVSQSYSAVVENAGASATEVRLVVTEAGVLKLVRDFLIAAGDTVTISADRLEGLSADEVKIVGRYESVKVYSIEKTVTVTASPDEDVFFTAAANIKNDGFSRVPDIVVAGRSLVFLEYEDDALGAVNSQEHTATVTESSGSAAARVRLAAGQEGFVEVELVASANEDIVVRHSGGDWDSPSKVVILKGQATVESISKTVEYAGSGDASAQSLSATASARVVVGSDITVDASWHVDAAGDYAGAGTVIKRPDHVIEHWLRTYMDFTAAEIDAATFAAAGVLYAAAISGGYRLDFVLTSKQPPSSTLHAMAWQSRSVVNYHAGVWFLNFIPDAAPAAVKTITKAELAGPGAMFTFSNTPVVNIVNQLTATYKRNYLPDTNESDWAASVKKTDAASVATYGDYVLDTAFGFIRSDDMASDVADHALLERKLPLHVVEFPVFFEHFDLVLGDTIEIDNDLYDGEKYYIQEIRKADKFRATVMAIEWFA
jgi:hypothetical protein